MDEHADTRVNNGECGGLNQIAADANDICHDLNAAIGALASRSDPSAYVMPGNTQHVVLVDDNRHVVEPYWLP